MATIDKKGWEKLTKLKEVWDITPEGWARNGE
jgi:hypothetical protein